MSCQLKVWPVSMQCSARHEFVSCQLTDPLCSLGLVPRRPCSSVSLVATRAGHLFGTRPKEHRGYVRRYDTNSYLALHCMDTGHLQLTGHPYPWIYQLPKGTRSDRSPTFGRTQRESIHAIRSMLQVNASTALINMPHPPPPFFPPPLLFPPH